MLKGWCLPFAISGGEAVLGHFQPREDIHHERARFFCPFLLPCFVNIKGESGSGASLRQVQRPREEGMPVAEGVHVSWQLKQVEGARTRRYETVPTGKVPDASRIYLMV